MRDDLTFETRLATALGRYAELAPRMDDLDVAERAIAAGRPSGLLGRLAELRRGLTSTFASPSTARFAYLLVILALLLAAVLVAVAVGVFRTDDVRPLGGNGTIVYTVQGDNHGPVVTYVANPHGTGLHETDQFVGPPPASAWFYGAPPTKDLAARVKEAITANAKDHGDTCPAVPSVQDPIDIGGEPGTLLGFDCGILIYNAITVHDGVAYVFGFRDPAVHAATSPKDRTLFAELLKSVTFPS